jgi:xanthine dehydrogenase accessory factor
MPMDGWGIMQQATELARRGEPFALATVVWRQGPSSSQQGAKALITADGELRGWIGGACAEPTVIREARDVIQTGTARLLLLGDPEQFGYPAPGASGGRAGGATTSGGSARSGSSRDAGELPAGMTFVPISCQSEGALEVYIEPVLPVPHLVVVGSSPMANTLADLGRALSWQVDLIAGQDFTAADASERSLVVVATQGHDDEGALERAVAARPAYVGLVGSHKRGDAVLGYLAERGADRETLARVRVPAGLDLGPTGHREIAVAILAELVQLGAAGQLAGQETAARPAAAGPAAAGPGTRAVTQATDPVCGMTVEVGAGTRSSQCEGQTYYFCSAGCQQVFEKRLLTHE